MKTESIRNIEDALKLARAGKGIATLEMAQATMVEILKVHKEAVTLTEYQGALIKQLEGKVAKEQAKNKKDLKSLQGILAGQKDLLEDLVQLSASRGSAAAALGLHGKRKLYKRALGDVKKALWALDRNL